MSIIKIIKIKLYLQLYTYYSVTIEVINNQ